MKFYMKGQDKKRMPFNKGDCMGRFDYSQLVVAFMLLNLQFSVQCFVYHYLSFCPFYFGHYIICFSSHCGFQFTLWHLQIFLIPDNLYTLMFLFKLICTLYLKMRSNSISQYFLIIKKMPNCSFNISKFKMFSCHRVFWKN